MWYILFLWVLLVLGGPAHAQKGLDLALLKRHAQIFEGIVRNVLLQNFPNPFAISEEPRGTYLQGYGIMVFFHLNINRGKIRTPFGEIDAPKTVADRTKEEKIRVVRDSMIQCLADYGSTIKQLNGHDRITISAHLEDRYELDPNKSTTVLVLAVSKDAVDLYATRKISLEKFKDKVQIVRY